MNDGRMVDPWAGGSFQASCRLTKELTDGTAFWKSHFAARKQVADLDLQARMLAGSDQPKRKESGGESSQNQGFSEEVSRMLTNSRREKTPLEGIMEIWKKAFDCKTIKEARSLFKSSSNQEQKDEAFKRWLSLCTTENEAREALMATNKEWREDWARERIRELRARP